MKIGVIGTGSVGTALAKGFVRIKQEVRLGSRDPKAAKAPPGIEVGPSREVASWADLVVLAVPYRVVREAAREVGPALVGGKILVDVTNPLSPSGDLVVGHTSSGAEELVKLLPGARIVKAFNTVFARYMAAGKAGNDTLTLFVASDDGKAKDVVLRLGRDMGFDAIDAGPLSASRYIEPIAAQMILLGARTKVGWNIGLRVVRGPA
ncbi:MAG: NADPH-dependent F420 reductase [Methanobacteriota archaeon]